MNRDLQAGIAIVTLTVVLGMIPNAVRAQSGEPRQQGADELKSEIAALRKKLRHLELEREKISLQYRVRELEAKRTQPVEREVRSAASVRVPPRDGDIAAATREALGAYAADMLVKAPLRVPYFDWSGFYAGINAGYSIGRDKTTLLLCSNAVPGDCRNVQFNMSPVGMIGGIQAGFNWHWSPNWVFGLEADLQGSGQKDTVCIFNCLLTGPFAPVVTTIEQNLNWFATLRARLGTPKTAGSGT